MMLLLLTIVLWGLVFLAWSERQGLLFPPFLFSIGFAVCATMLLMFNVWETDISWTTFVVVSSGVACFAVCCVIIKRLDCKARLAKDEEISLVPISRCLICISILIEMVVVVWSAYQITLLFPSNSLMSSIAQYGIDFKFHGGDGSLGALLDNIRLLCVAWTYFISYLLAQELVQKRYSNAALLSVAFVLGCLVQLETGGRYGTFMFISVLIVCYIILLCQRHRAFPIRITSKQIICAVFIIIAVLVFLRFGAVGRETSSYGFIEYLTIYCGAELLNLDLFINADEWFQPAVHGWATFGLSLGWLGDHLGIASWQYHPNSFDILPYQEIHGHDLGNVYTCFYSYILDFGYLGILVCIVPMAVLSQICFDKARGALKSKRKDMWIVLYGFIAVQLLMSFFSDKFYSELASLSSLKLIVLFCLLRWLYLRGASHSRLMVGGPSNPSCGARDNNSHAVSVLAMSWRTTHSGFDAVRKTNEDPFSSISKGSAN